MYAGKKRPCGGVWVKFQVMAGSRKWESVFGHVCSYAGKVCKGSAMKNGTARQCVLRGGRVAAIPCCSPVPEMS